MSSDNVSTNGERRLGGFRDPIQVQALILCNGFAHNPVRRAAADFCQALHAPFQFIIEFDGSRRSKMKWSQSCEPLSK